MRKPWITGCFVAIIAFVVEFIIGVLCIKYSSSSTAAIGFIFLPFEAFIAAIPFFVIGFCTHYGVVKLRQHARIGYLFVTIAAVLTAYFIGTFVYNSALLRAVNNVRTMSPSQQSAFLDDSIWRTNKYVLGALLECSDLSAESLHQIAMIPSPDLHRRMWATPPIMGENRRGLAVMRLVALHPNVDVQTLVGLAKSPDRYVRGSVAGNSKTPVEILRHFYSMEGGGQLIDWGLARNPNTPVDILRELAKSSNQYTRRYVERNPGFSVEDLGVEENE
jgi:hypothetical protein